MKSKILVLSNIKEISVAELIERFDDILEDVEKNSVVYKVDDKCYLVPPGLYDGENFNIPV